MKKSFVIAYIVCFSYNFIQSVKLHGNQIESTVSINSVKQRLDVYLSLLLTEKSRSFIGNLCENGMVSVNCKTQGKNYKVRLGDLVSVKVEQKLESKVIAEFIPLDIIYEDDDIIAINKPAGMVVHPAIGSPNGTFVNALLYHLGSNASFLLNSSVSLEVSTNFDEDEILENDLPETPEAASATPMSLRPGIVHRLDKGTSGVLLAGKHSEAVAKLSKIFALRNIKKTYLAVCVGHPGEATMVDSIGRSQKNRQLMTVYDGPPGKPAITHVRTVLFNGKLSVALVRIETGRFD